MPAPYENQTKISIWNLLFIYRLIFCCCHKNVDHRCSPPTWIQFIPNRIYVHFIQWLPIRNAIVIIIFIHDVSRVHLFYFYLEKWSVRFYTVAANENN